MALLKRLIPVGVAIVVALGWWGFNTFKAKADAPEVGECVTISGSATDAEVEAAECGGDDVLFKVTADDGDCDLTEGNYTVEVRGSDAVDLCLFYEVEAGDCIKGGAIETKVACADHRKARDVVKVVSVADGAKGKCRKSQPIANTKRDKLVCIAPNG